MKFSLIIPCYNESRNLPLLFERGKSMAARPGIEIVLVDNGSTDDTPAVLSSLLPSYPGFRTIRVEHNQGYGFGIVAGLKAAQGEILGWTHADMQTDLQDCLRGLEIFATQGSQVFVKGRRHGRPLSDVLFTVGMSLFETVLLRKPMWDINAQPNMFSRAFFNCWDTPPDDFSLDLYVYYQAHVNKLNIHRFPVVFGDRAFGESHWNVNWAAKWKFIRRTVVFSLQLKKKLSK